MRPFLKLFEYQDEKGLKIIEHETLIKKIKIHLRIELILFTILSHLYLICIQFQDLLAL